MSHGGSIHELELLLLVLLLFVVGLGTLAQRLKTPYPIVLVIGGLILSLVPHVPQFALNPDIVFLVLLPPLLFEAAFNTSWRDFRHNLVSILLLAFGLVGFTAAGVALAAHWIIPGFDWRIGLVLGAVVSPTDALAATSIAKRVHLPRRITDILEGESLVNDASGLILLQFAITMVVSGVQPSVPQELAKLLWLMVGGVGIGILLGKIIYLFEGRVDNAPVEITASFLFPYLAYLAGEEIKASGILATVACGLFLGRRSSVYFSSTVRLQAWSTWNTLSYALNGIAFVLIGLQLREVPSNRKPLTSYFWPPASPSLSPSCSVYSGSFPPRVSRIWRGTPCSSKRNRKCPPRRCLWSAGRECAESCPLPPLYRYPERSPAERLFRNGE